MLASRRPKLDREIAARALCRLHGNPEDIQFEGKPMWMSFLNDVDVVLETVGWGKVAPEEQSRQQVLEVNNDDADGPG